MPKPEKKLVKYFRSHLKENPRIVPAKSEKTITAIIAYMKIPGNPCCFGSLYGTR
ncbi:MAG: hypothetical protein J4473_03625 [Candidatus Aenigmarchaeota archaeon]|nr:hypothetical protein [Candidatus Aenigmarchaeota archaeon]